MGESLECLPKKAGNEFLVLHRTLNSHWIEFRIPIELFPNPLIPSLSTFQFSHPSHEWGLSEWVGFGCPLGLNHKILAQPSLSWEFYMLSQTGSTQPTRGLLMTFKSNFWADLQLRARIRFLEDKGSCRQTRQWIRYRTLGREFHSKGPSHPPGITPDPSGSLRTWGILQAEGKEPPHWSGSEASTEGTVLLPGQELCKDGHFHWKCWGLQHIHHQPGPFLRGSFMKLLIKPIPNHPQCWITSQTLCSKPAGNPWPNSKVRPSSWCARRSSLTSSGSTTVTEIQPSQGWDFGNIPWNGWRGRCCPPAPPGATSASVGLWDPVEIGELQELLLADIIHHVLEKREIISSREQLRSATGWALFL